MYRKLDVASFEDCNSNLTTQEGCLTTMINSLNSAESGNASDEFVDGQAASVYTSMINAFQSKYVDVDDCKLKMIVHQGLLYDDDSEHANRLRQLNSALQELAQSMGVESSITEEKAGSATVTITGVDTLTITDGSKDIEAELPRLTYDEYMALTDEEKREYEIKLIEFVKQLYLEGLIEMPIDGTISVEISPGMVIYISAKFDMSDEDLAKINAIDFYNENNITELLDKIGEGSEITAENPQAQNITISENVTMYGSLEDKINEVGSVYEQGIEIINPTIPGTDEEIEGKVTISIGVEITEVPAWQSDNSIKDAVVAGAQAAVDILADFEVGVMATVTGIFANTVDETLSTEAFEGKNITSVTGVEISESMVVLVAPELSEIKSLA